MLCALGSQTLKLVHTVSSPEVSPGGPNCLACSSKCAVRCLLLCPAYHCWLVVVEVCGHPGILWMVCRYTYVACSGGQLCVFDHTVCPFVCCAVQAAAISCHEVMILLYPGLVAPRPIISCPPMLLGHALNVPLSAALCRVETLHFTGGPSAPLTKATKPPNCFSWFALPVLQLSLLLHRHLTKVLISQPHPASLPSGQQLFVVISWQHLVTLVLCTYGHYPPLPISGGSCSLFACDFCAYAARDE